MSGKKKLHKVLCRNDKEKKSKESEVKVLCSVPGTQNTS